LQYSIPGALAGLLVLLIINKFRLNITPFTLIMAVFTAINSILMTFCSFKALGKINLSLYSLFCMLGGMVLPFIQGILFYGEDLGIGKILCFILIFTALMLTVKKDGKKSGTVYYIGVFVLNGMSGVLSKLFNELPFEKTNAASYSMLSAIVSVLMASAVLLIFYRENTKEEKSSIKAYALSISSGALNKVANYWLVIALLHVDASVQYPMVTGGVIIISTLLSYFTPKKPGIRELISVVLAFVGIMLLVLL
jgi:drug/metabolite transporter (DMT)-like permease